MLFVIIEGRIWGAIMSAKAVDGYLDIRFA